MIAADYDLLSGDRCRAANPEVQSVGFPDSRCGLVVERVSLGLDRHLVIVGLVAALMLGATLVGFGGQAEASE